jgi:lipoic acid synthetase
MKDLKETGCDMLTIGQYLAPDRVRNTAVRRFVSPVAFKMYEAAGKRLGFKCVSSGPFVRSSYLAEEMHDELKEACHGKSAVAAVG